MITTPPAKYDAEGLAGIINIITKKNMAEGYSGNINTNYNTVGGARLNLNTTAKQGKFGITAFVGTSDRPLRYSEFDNQTTFITTPLRTLQNGQRGNGNTNSFGSAELSYELDTLNLLTGTFNIYKNDSHQGNDQFTSLYNASNALTQAYHVVNNGTGAGTGHDMALNYQLGFKHNKDQFLTSSYKYSTFDNRQFNDITTTQSGAQNYRQYNNAYSKEHTAQLDYIQPFKLLTFEAGGKMILRNSFSGFNNDVFNGSFYQTDPAQTNNFNYHQDVYSLYNSYTLKVAQWTVKGGLRFESTDIDADFTSTATTVNQKFNNLVPSVSIQRALKNNNSLTFGFTQRIQRPGIFQLNPFADISNPLYVTVGNPQLRPAVNNNFELSYGNYNKGSFTFSTHYQFANNTIQNIASVNGNVTTTTFANIGKTRQLGADLNTNYPITKRMNININAELLQVWLQGTYSGQLFKNSGQQGHLFTNSTYKFDDGYRIGLNLGFDSRYVLIQGRDNWFFSSSAYVAKDFLKGKVSASASVANPFSKFNKLDFFTETPDFATVSSNLNFYRTINFSLLYKFGRLNSDIKKNKRGINNDDAAGGR